MGQESEHSLAGYSLQGYSQESAWQPHLEFAWRRIHFLTHTTVSGIQYLAGCQTGGRWFLPCGLLRTAACSFKVNRTESESPHKTGITILCCKSTCTSSHIFHHLCHILLVRKKSWVVPTLKERRVGTPGEYQELEIMG